MSAALLVGAACFPSIARQPEFCLRDADRDGQPMFGNTMVRTGFEVYNGVPYGSKPTAAAFADLDGDGDPDAAVINSRPQVPPGLSFVAVHLNAGDGVFSPADVPYPVGWEGTDIAVADLDGDGDVDAAVANARENNVSILFNRGDGTFDPHVTHAAGDMPRCVRIADVEGDGDFDLVVLNIQSHDVSILRNLGGGAFAPQTRVFVGNVTQRGDPNLNFAYPGPFLALGDLDGDGDVDAAAPAKSKIKILLNDGAGVFTLAGAPPSVAFGSAYAIVIADLDGDSDLDLAASCFSGTGGPNCLSVLLNSGGGSFGPAAGYNAGWTNSVTSFQWAVSITAGDVDADRDLDLVVGHEVGPWSVLMRNGGDGTFAPKEMIEVHDGSWSVGLAELNADGRIDLAVLATWSRPKLCVLLNDGKGDLTTYARYPRATPPCCEDWTWVDAADLDLDGDTDLVATMDNMQYPYHVKVLRNDARGQFDDITPYALAPEGTATGESVSIGDLNGDTIPDLVVCDAIASGGWVKPGKVWTMMGLGDGAFGPPTPYPFVDAFPKHAAIADFDGDGDRDLGAWTAAVYPGDDFTPVDRRVSVLANDGRGVFSLVASHTLARLPWSTVGQVAALDIDADGDVDLAATAAANSGAGALVVLRNDGSGAFTTAQTAVTPPRARALCAGDLDGDLREDLIVQHNIADGPKPWPYLTTWRNTGEGFFELRDSVVDRRIDAAGRMGLLPPAGSRPGRLATPINTGGVLIHATTGAAMTANGVGFTAGSWPTAVVFGDFNGDGRVDLAASTNTDRSVSVLLGRSCAGCYVDCDADGRASTADFACFQSRFVGRDPYADCNHDGVLTVRDFACFQNRFVVGCP
ncbi:MAG: FG-GAP-like repeat-containing protein [Phycisphaerales bacterium]